MKYTVFQNSGFWFLRKNFFDDENEDKSFRDERLSFRDEMVSFCGKRVISKRKRGKYKDFDDIPSIYDEYTSDRYEGIDKGLGNIYREFDRYLHTSNEVIGGLDSEEVIIELIDCIKQEFDWYEDIYTCLDNVRELLSLIEHVKDSEYEC